MGIYDRDYYREQRPGVSLRGPRTAVGFLILLNGLIYLANGLLTPGPPGSMGGITSALALSVGALTKPWLWWQFGTYGFAHDPSPWHVVVNMFGLWMFGRDIEWTYGRAEFVRLYLALLVFGSVVWMVTCKLSGAPPQATLIGASGAVVGIVVLFALHFPQRTLLLFFVLPVPAWLVGVGLVAMDVFGVLAQRDSQVAFSVHLAGAAFALAYYRFGWNIGRLAPGGFRLDWLKPRPKLRVHEPDRFEPHEPESELSDEVDRILAKIHEEGEASLTRKERRTLETASRQYQRKRQGPGE